MADTTSQDATGLNTQQLDVMAPEQALAQHARVFRTKAGMTQRQVVEGMVARGFSMVQSTIADIENGHRAVRLNEAVALAAVLGVRLDDLIAAPAETAADRERAAHREREVEALAEVRRLEAQVQARESDLAAADAALQDAKNRLAMAKRQHLRLMLSPAVKEDD